MSVKYIPSGNAKIVIDKKAYQNDGEKKAVLPVDKISEKELQVLVDRRLVVKLELDENGSHKSDSADKEAEKAAKKREAIIANAKKLGVEVTDEMTVEEIQQLIKKAVEEKKSQEGK